MPKFYLLLQSLSNWSEIWTGSTSISWLGGHNSKILIFVQIFFICLNYPKIDDFSEFSWRKCQNFKILDLNKKSGIVVPWAFILSSCMQKISSNGPKTKKKIDFSYFFKKQNLKKNAFFKLNFIIFSKNWECRSSKILKNDRNW